MAGQVLMFGLGVTRSGSTWLHDCLSKHPQVHLQGVKEAHWFDTQSDGSIPRRLDILRARSAHLAQIAGPEAARLRADLDGLVAAFESGRGDPAYLDWLASGADAGTRLIGDITPAYALLPEARLARMQALSPMARFVIVLRDPLSRLLSNVRLNAARAVRGATERAAHAGKVMQDWLAGRHGNLEKRSDYSAMFARIDRVIAPERLMVLFFEEMFTPASMARLTAWLGLDRHSGALPARVHASAKVAIDPTLIAQAHRRLAPQYAFARVRFGAALPRAWDAPQTRGLT